MQNSWKANCLAHFVALLGLWFSLPLLDPSFVLLLLHIFPLIHPHFLISRPPLSDFSFDIREQISISVTASWASLIAVDLMAHVMISALFNSCSCNHLFLLFKKKGKRDNGSTCCKCNQRLNGLWGCLLTVWFIFRTIRMALINRPREESDRARMQIPNVVAASLYLCVIFYYSFVGFFYFCPYFCFISSSSLSVPSLTFVSCWLFRLLPISRVTSVFPHFPHQSVSTCRLSLFSNPSFLTLFIHINCSFPTASPINAKRLTFSFQTISFLLWKRLTAVEQFECASVKRCWDTLITFIFL